MEERKKAREWMAFLESRAKEMDNGQREERRNLQVDGKLLPELHDDAGSKDDSELLSAGC